MLSNYCFTQNTQEENILIDADSLINNIDKYVNTNVKIEGDILHVCGVDGKKLKLKTKQGEIIKVIYPDNQKSFDNYFNKKHIVVYGQVSETRINKTEIDQFEKEKTLLCHIDQTACKDSAWVKKQEDSGKANEISSNDIINLRKKMQSTGKDYISQITIIAYKIDIIENEKE